jgi:hypothetical protein
MKKIFVKLSDIRKETWNIIFRISSVLLSLWILWTLGWRGIVGMGIGVFGVTWLFLSKNTLVWWLVKKTMGEWFMNDIIKTGEEFAMRAGRRNDSTEGNTKVRE